MPSVTRRRPANRETLVGEVHVVRGAGHAGLGHHPLDADRREAVAVGDQPLDRGEQAGAGVVATGDLLRAWFAEITGELREAAASWWQLQAPVAYDDVRAALARIVDTYRPHTPLMAAVYDTAAYDASVREMVTAMMDENTAGLRSHIRHGQAAGFVDPDLVPKETAAWLTWMAERGLHQLVRRASDAELVRLVDSYARIVWNTLYRPQAITQCDQ